MPDVNMIEHRFVTMCRTNDTSTRMERPTGGQAKLENQDHMQAKYAENHALAALSHICLLST